MVAAFSVTQLAATSGSTPAMVRCCWPGVGQAGVDFVGADEQAVAQTEFGDALQLVAGVNAADRIVRVAEEQEARLRLDGRLEGVEVDFVALDIAVLARDQRRAMCGARGIIGGAEEGPVVWRLDEDAFVSLDVMANGVKPADHAGHNQDVFGRGVHAVKLAVACADRLLHPASGRKAASHAVAEDAVSDALLQSLGDRRRRKEIHVRRPRGDDVRVVAIPLGAVRAATVDNFVKVEGRHTCSLRQRLRAL